MSSAYWRQTGAIWPMGVPTSLTWYDIGALLTLLHLFDVRLIIEIGVEHGGASAVFAARCRYLPECSYYGIDITLDQLDPSVAALDGERIYRRNAWLSQTVDEVAQWVRESAGACLIFCDGGDKPKELHLYAPLLRPGDVLVGHDRGNEYREDAIADIALDRISADWLDDTLLCAWRAA